MQNGSPLVDTVGVQLRCMKSDGSELVRYVALTETHLGLYFSQLTALPAEIGGLTSLTELCVSHNLLAALPAEIGTLTNLTNLRVDHNRLTALPAEIGTLTNLTGSVWTTTS
eukprot:TRINITY_DN2596_c1_g1_i6.p1 TRINITY_DN2596_c1_g1~~TRINITY_DN2596_c1_g1_i6.p1  ORF type:complete len:112 (-),score=18.73 TRINITY_DN2596_c1_g1_i6:72-407(-)